MSENKTESGREIKRTERIPNISEDDLQIAIQLDKEGKEVPASLQEALAEHKTKSGSPAAPKGDEGGSPGDPNPGQKPKSEDDPSKKKPTAGEGEGGEGGDDDNGEGEGGGKEGEGNKNVVPDKPLERAARMLPYSKFQTQKEKWEKRETELLKKLEETENSHKAEIEALRKANAAGDQKQFDTAVKELAEKTGLDTEQITALTDFFKGMIPAISPEILDKLKKLEEKKEEKPGAPSDDDPVAKEEKFWKKQEEDFDKEFTAELKKSSTDPEMEKHKDEIKELAFTDGFTKKSVWEIWNRHVKPKHTSKNPPPESPGGFNGGSGSQEKDWDAISKDPEAIKNLSIADAEKFTEYMGSKSRRPIRRAIR